MHTLVTYFGFLRQGYHNSCTLWTKIHCLLSLTLSQTIYRVAYECLRIRLYIRSNREKNTRWPNFPLQRILINKIPLPPQWIQYYRLVLGVTSQKTVTIIVTAVRNANLARWKHPEHEAGLYPFDCHVCNIFEGTSCTEHWALYLGRADFGSSRNANRIQRLCNDLW